MQLSKLGHALTWAVGITSVAAAPTVADISVVTRNTPGTTLANTVAGFRRALLDARLNKRQSVWSNQTTIEKTFDGATLFAASGSVKNGNDSADISVVCSTCYVKTTATAQLSVDGNLNVSQAITNATNAVENEFIAIAAAAWNYTEVYLNTLISPSASAPPIDVDFALNIPAIPEVTLSFQFNDTELYMEIDTVIEGSVGYTVTLYKSDTPLGISFEGNNIGIVFTVDLILNANDDIDISSGFHIKLDDGVQFDIALFAKDIAKATLPGGQFEFLPITVENAGVVLNAVLQIKITAGIEIDTSTLVAGFTEAVAEQADFSAGLSVELFADLADLTTNVTYVPEGDREGCELRVEETYGLVVGGNAGATVGVLDHIWGPDPNNTIPVFFTSFGACLISATPTSAGASAIQSVRTAPITITTIVARDISSTAVVSTTATITNIICLSAGHVNCPASLQSSATTTTVLTTTVTGTGSVLAAALAGTYPATTGTSVSSTATFGSSAQKLVATAGSPTSYKPPATSSTSTSSSSSSTVTASTVSPVAAADASTTPAASTTTVSASANKGVVIGVSATVATIAIVGTLFLIVSHFKKLKAKAAAYARMNEMKQNGEVAGGAKSDDSDEEDASDGLPRPSMNPWSAEAHAI